MIGLQQKNLERSFLQSMVFLVIPIAMQNLFSAAVSSADVIMLSYVGQTALSAVSLANQVQFILQLFYMGLGIGIGVLTAQYWGKKDCLTIEKIMGFALKLSLLLSLVFAVAACFFSEQVMLLFTDDTELMKTGSVYLKVVGLTYLFMAVSQVYLTVMKSVEQVRMSTLIGSVPLILNVFLNAAFIFGWFGLPKMGVFGVALATLLARFVEVVWCLLHAGHNQVVTFRLSFILHTEHWLLRDFVKFASPAVIQGLMFGTAFSMYSVIMGHLNADVVAANSIVSVVRNFANILSNSVAAGGSILVGNELGAMMLERAERDAKKLWICCIGFGVLGGILILLARPWLLRWSDLTPAAEQYFSTMLFMNSYYVIGHAANVVFMDIFSAGGDTKFGMWCDGVVMWLIALPISFLSAFLLKLPPMTVYFIICLDEFFKTPLCVIHYRKKTWLKNITHESES